MLAGVAADAHAQATGAIRGRVVQAATNRPVASAQVFLPALSRGALANAAGEFQLPNVPVGTHELRVEVLGFAPAQQQVNVAAGQTAMVTFELSVTAVGLDEIVVTGTAGVTSKRTIGNSITNVDAAAITQQTAITSLTELLQSKARGVQILPNSGTLGTAADIRIRGAGSLTQIRPVVFVDGVRYNIDDLGTLRPPAPASHRSVVKRPRHSTSSTRTTSNRSKW